MKINLQCKPDRSEQFQSQRNTCPDRRTDRVRDAGNRTANARTHTHTHTIFHIYTCHNNKAAAEKQIVCSSSITEGGAGFARSAAASGLCPAHVDPLNQFRIELRAQGHTIQQHADGGSERWYAGEQGGSGVPAIHLYAK